MVGLRLKSGLEAKEGDSLYGQEELPWAAALSDALLASKCAACFGACTPSRFTCQSACQGAIAYCSLFCRDLDFPLHIHSGECSLLALLQSPASTSSRSSLLLDESCLHKRSIFPSLGGTCDLRAALRLLAHHETLCHIAPFLAASGSGLECPRLGGLLSNRSTLLQRTQSDEVDKTAELQEEEMLIATELRKAAMLMHQARYSTSLCFTSNHNEGVDRVPGTSTDVCMGSGRAQGHLNAHMDAYMSTTVHRGSKHLDHIASTHGKVLTHKEVYMATNRYPGTHETTDGSIHVHKDVYIATSGHHSTHDAIHADAATTLADELLLLEEVICQVFTNGVHIQVDTWFTDGQSHVRSDDLGTAVYGPLLSWINHSCRPNAFYSFVLDGPTTLKGTLEVPLVPDRDVKALEDAWGLKSCCFPWFERGNCQGKAPDNMAPRLAYGPSER